METSSASLQNPKKKLVKLYLLYKTNSPSVIICSVYWGFILPMTEKLEFGADEARIYKSICE
jgi:hypothetical protein